MILLFIIFTDKRSWLLSLQSN